MSSFHNKSKTIFFASVGVGLFIGGGVVFLHRKLKSRLRLITDRVELMEDQICDLKDLVTTMINEEKAESKLEDKLKQNNSIPIVSSRSSNKKKLSAQKSSSGNFGASDSSLDDDDFVEATESFYKGIASGDEYELAEERSVGGVEMVVGNNKNTMVRKENGEIGSKAGDGEMSYEEMLRGVDQMFESGDEGRRQAFHVLRKHSESKDVQILWRVSKATYYLAKQLLSSSPPPSSSSSLPPLTSPSSSSPSMSPSSSLPQASSSSSSLLSLSSSSSPQELIYEAFRLASEAVKADDCCADAHKWYAITLGSTNDYESTNVRIQNGYSFKQHIERAIELKPTDPSNHHLLGRWSYGVYMLSWVERKVAAALFSTPPSSSVQQALALFLKAEELNPGKWKENEMYIAKCYLEMSKYKEAGDWLKRCQRLPCLTNEDRKNQHEIEELISKHSYYLQ